MQSEGAISWHEFPGGRLEGSLAGTALAYEGDDQKERILKRLLAGNFAHWKCRHDSCAVGEWLRLYPPSIMLVAAQRLLATIAYALGSSLRSHPYLVITSMKRKCLVVSNVILSFAAVVCYAAISAGAPAVKVSV